MSAVLQIFVGTLASVFTVATVLNAFGRLTFRGQTDVTVVAMIAMAVATVWLVYKARS